MAENGEHHSARPYFFVWVLLIALTATTWATGRMHLGTWALPLALAIAIAKSLLVILFFMHLWEQKGVNRIVIGTSVIRARRRSASIRSSDAQNWSWSSERCLSTSGRVAR